MFRVLIFVALIAFSVSHVHAQVGDGPVPAPPVLWKIKAEAWENTFSIFGPRDRDRAFTDFDALTSVPITVAASSAGKVSEAGAAAAYAFQFDPSRASAVLTTSTDWISKFILEHAEARITIEGYVRGGRGTQYAFRKQFDGSWSADKTPGFFAGLSGLGEDFPLEGSSLDVRKQFPDDSDIGFAIANGTPVIFDAFPGHQYTREPLLTTAFNVYADARRTCPFPSCGDEDRLVGSGTAKGFVQVSLLSTGRAPGGPLGIVPGNPNGTPNPGGTIPILNRGDRLILAATPLAGSLPSSSEFSFSTSEMSLMDTAEIKADFIHYNWYLNEELVSFGADSFNDFLFLDVGLNQVRVEGVDFDGNRFEDSISINVIPEPASASMAFICGLTFLKRRYQVPISR